MCFDTSSVKKLSVSNSCQSIFIIIIHHLPLKKLLLFIIILFLLDACSSIDVYEKTEAFSKHAWGGNNKLTFTFTITDTTVLYNIYAVIRHTDAYHWNNMWLGITTIAPGDTARAQQVNLKLGDNTKGWLGAAMDDIIEHRVLLTRYPIKLKKGNYNFILRQIMREDPLQNVMNAGIRVEKAVQ
jgi:gliding motility-associated lipoprotein GldH